MPSSLIHAPPAASESDAKCSWLFERLARSVPCAYHVDGAPASEPTALAGLALANSGAIGAAQIAADWLASMQMSNGSIGVTQAQKTPCWPTSLAILLWHALDSHTAAPHYAANLQNAVRWALAERGKAIPRGRYIQHDTTLIGWSWSPNTHSWLEPTAMFVLALKAVGHAQHSRTREAVRMLIDRLLPAGGANYGNTIVLGQPLLPHVQPTGLAMLALADEGENDPRIERSLEYLERKLPQTTSMASLCYGLLGLTAHGRRPTAAEAWLQRAYLHIDRKNDSSYKLSLLALASDTNSMSLFQQQEVAILQRR